MTSVLCLIITNAPLQKFFVTRVTRIKSKIERECGIGMVGEVTAVAARQNPGMRRESVAGKWCGRHRDLLQVLPDFREALNRNRLRAVC